MTKTLSYTETLVLDTVVNATFMEDSWGRRCDSLSTIQHRLDCSERTAIAIPTLAKAMERLKRLGYVKVAKEYIHVYRPTEKAKKAVRHPATEFFYRHYGHDVSIELKNFYSGE